MVSLIDIIEANLKSLVEVLETEKYMELSLPLKFYSKTIFYYLQSRNQELEQHCKCILSRLDCLDDEISNIKLIYYLSRARLNIRSARFEKKITDQLLVFTKDLSLDPVWIGEVYFVLGLTAELEVSFASALLNYENSYRYFNKGGANKKALKAKFNALAMRSRVYPQGYYLVEYYAFIKQAKKTKLSSVVGVAFTNISREYQRLGALKSAEKNANLAIGYLRKYDFGGLDYYLAVLQRADVLLDQKQPSTAKLDIDEALVSPLLEIKGAIVAINFKHRLSLPISNELTTSLNNKLQPAWRERFDRKIEQERSASPFSQMECNLLNILGKGPKSRMELILALYPENIDTVALENRLKNLLGRIRQKKPNLIRKSDGKYMIADPLYFSRKFQAI